MLEIFRIVLVSLYMCAMSFVMLIFFAIRPFHYPWIQPFGRFFGRGALFLLGLKIKGDLTQLENMSSSVIVGNHQHNLDVFIYSSIFPPRCVSIGKKSILKIPFFGQLYYLTGQILIDRGNRKSAWSSMAVAAKKLVDHELNVLIFPEGTRSKGRGILPFKRGPFFLAKEAQKPINIILISDVINGVDLNRWNAGEIHFKVFDPIPVEVVKEKTAEELSAMTREIFEREIPLLNKSLNLQPISPLA